MSTDPKNLVGVTLSGRYKIERPIGEGGMGAVFEATQLSLGRHIAIKVVKPGDGADGVVPDESIKRFERETEAIAKLAHPNIVQVLDAGRADDGTTYLAMELLEGENVRQLVRRERAVPTPRALAILEDVASALVAAHGAGVIHRDLKGENVMLVRAAGKEETAKVLDFGVAKVTSQTEAPPVTGSGFVAGTPGCIAPEQMLGKSDDPRSDLYSVGVLAFEMLAGRAPFVAGSTMELMLKHLSEPAPSVAAVARQSGFSVPAPVDALVASLLEKDPERRPRDARAFLDVVRGLRDADRATIADVPIGGLPTPGGFPGLPTPEQQMTVGSRVVATVEPPTAPAHPAPPTSPASSTSPTTSMPSVTAACAPQLKRGRPLLRLALTVAAAFAAFTGYWRFSVWRANQPSRVPAAAAAIERAEDDLWRLDLDSLDHDTQAAIAADPDAARSHLLQAAGKLIYRSPLVRVDADLVLAKAAAERRGSMLAVRTPTSSFIGVLSLFSASEMTRAMEVHVKNFGCEPLDTEIVALKLMEISAPLDLLDEALKHIGDDDRPLALFTRARIAEQHGNLDEAHALLARAEEQAPGRLAIVDALADVDLRRGDRASAEARLEKVAAREDAAAIRLAALRARDGQADAFDAVTERVHGLPAHSVQRIDELASIGYHLAALGRFREAEKLWRESIADRPPGDVLGNARALELAAVVMFFGLTADDASLTQRWSDVLGEIPLVSGAGSERLAVFTITSRALSVIMSGKKDLSEAHADLALLEKSKNDIPLLAHEVRFYLALAEHRLDDAIAAASQVDPCFREHNMAMVAALEGDLDGRRARLDVAVSPEIERRCTTGDETLSYLGQVSFACALGERAALALKSGDVDGARALVVRYHRFWPSADPPPEGFGDGRVSGRSLIRDIEAKLPPP